MKKAPVVLDLETKYTFREFSDHKKLKISVAGLYDFATGEGKTFLENELNALFRILENVPVIIGFNINSFDLPVLQAYYPGNVSQFKTFDILDDIKRIIGRRLALNDLIFGTLRKKKTGHGLVAIELFKQGKIDELRKYCLDDVLLTKELFEYGVKHGELKYLNETGEVSIPVDWKKHLESVGNSNTHLTLPF